MATKKPQLYRLDKSGRFVLLEPSEIPTRTVTKTRTVKVEVVQPGPIEVAVTALPKMVQNVMNQIMEDPQLNEGVRCMTERWQEFSSPVAAILAGIYVVPAARQVWEDYLDSKWAANAVPREAGEVIIGAGVQAAIYAVMRVRMGHPAPTVFEARERAGGVFAISKKPSFYLNSRNRPGPIGLPGRPGTALNVIPGGWVQPSDLTSAEYIDNATMAFVVRANLALAGCKVVVNTRVNPSDTFTVINNSYNYKTGKYRTPGITITPPGARCNAKRVLWATGLWTQNKLIKGKAPQGYLTFLEFMEGMDKTFPLQGMKRVAVIGAGDSALTAIEALTGRGPAPGMCVPALDAVEKIDWFGATCLNKQSWLQVARSRYKALGASLPDDTLNVEVRYEAAKIIPRGRLANAAAIMVSSGTNAMRSGLEIDLRLYDYVIDCTGLNESPVPAKTVYRNGDDKSRRLAMSDGQLSFMIGPVAGLELSPAEIDLFGKVSENGVAIFRYATRTAQLAQKLPAV